MAAQYKASPPQVYVSFQPPEKKFMRYSYAAKIFRSRILALNTRALNLCVVMLKCCVDPSSEGFVPFIACAAALWQRNVGGHDHRG
jgi:hypothetical protein